MSHSRMAFLTGLTPLASVVEYCRTMKFAVIIELPFLQSAALK
jgi:hypothetical protein